jgi:hypothetical protein
MKQRTTINNCNKELINEKGKYIYEKKKKKYGKRGRRTRSEESRKDKHFRWRCNTTQLI